MYFNTFSKFLEHSINYETIFHNCSFMFPEGFSNLLLHNKPAVRIPLKTVIRAIKMVIRAIQR
jgi:hypothetical protein